LVYKQYLLDLLLVLPGTYSNFPIPVFLMLFGYTVPRSVNMPHVRPGRYMLYCPEERPDRPPWPVVVLKNDILPPVLRKAKLYELDVPIFLFQKAEV
jgi:hypothetical protein